MIEAQRGQRLTAVPNLSRRAFENRTKSRERQTSKRWGHPRTRADGEQQLVLFTTVKGMIESRAGEARRICDLSSDAGCEAEALEIERQAIAQINGRRSPKRKS